MKKPIVKMTVLITVGICIFSFIPAVTAAKNSYIRPINDWADNTWFIPNIYDPDNDLLFVSDYYYFDYYYEGHVLEKRDATGFMISVKLHIYDLFVGILDSNDFIVFPGFADVNFQITFHLNYEIPGGWIPAWGGYNIEPGIRDHGCILPFIGEILYFGNIIGAEFVSMHLLATGEGVITEYGETLGYTPGMASFNVNDIELFKPNLDPNHPNMYYDILVPAENIVISQDD